MDASEANKRVVRDMITAVWQEGNVDALEEFWTDGAVNHSDQSGGVGLAALRVYHQDFAHWMVGLSELRIEVAQQICEGDRVVTHLISHARHTGTVADIPASGRQVRLVSMRIDRIAAGKIDEHWSVADTAGFIDQLRG